MFVESTHRRADELLSAALYLQHGIMTIRLPPGMDCSRQLNELWKGHFFRLLGLERFASITAPLQEGDLLLRAKVICMLASTNESLCMIERLSRACIGRTHQSPGLL
ncbi:MAG: hypothetical protein SP1CHLAM54_16040 [Chlamydiia bacterium]|nr:hypothetical protein [Chlamydiia bacterium]MCH9616493.1 hypothetical protein [Chlamydiia bacterium]MCH9629521.1 hypothetical protein [Chlamydiia bacterium]